MKRFARIILLINLSFTNGLLAEPPVMPSGDWEGEEVNVSSRRSIELVDQDENTHIWTVKYFYHDGQFWQAQIPTDKVDKVIGQRFNFGPKILGFQVPLNHVQARLTFKEGAKVKLFPLEESIDEASEPAHELDELATSLEAVGPIGRIWNLADAIRGNFVNAYRMLSMSEVIFERFYLYKETIHQTELHLKDQEKTNIIQTFIKRSTLKKMTEIYFLIRRKGFWCESRNCGTAGFGVLDESVIDRGMRYKIFRTLRHLPWAPRLYLWLRGIEYTVLETLNKEIEGMKTEGHLLYPLHKALRKRHREYLKSSKAARQAAREERRNNKVEGVSCEVAGWFRFWKK